MSWWTYRIDNEAFGEENRFQKGADLRLRSSLICLGLVTSEWLTSRIRNLLSCSGSAPGCRSLHQSSEGKMAKACEIWAFNASELTLRGV
jgi:hypothetical protein